MVDQNIVVHEQYFSQQRLEQILGDVMNNKKNHMYDFDDQDMDMDSMDEQAILGEME